MSRHFVSEQDRYRIPDGDPTANMPGRLGAPVEYEDEVCGDCVWVDVTRVSPCSRHGAQELQEPAPRERITSRPCSICSAPALELDNCGFSAGNLQREGTCYYWGRDFLTCNARKPQPRSFNQCWTGPYEVPWQPEPKARWSKK